MEGEWVRTPFRFCDVVVIISQGIVDRLKGREVLYPPRVPI